jgi:hypothetical protein
MMFRGLAFVLLAILANAAVEAAESQLEFDYDTSRRAFRDLANEVISNSRYGSAEIRPTLETLKVEYPGRENDDLTMDALVIPATKKKSLVIQINSGVHGLEHRPAATCSSTSSANACPSCPKNCSRKRRSS